jgi:c(7)-type cytochrome triheme protein
MTFRSLPLVLLLLGGGLSWTDSGRAEDAPFSHRVHLKTVGLSCTACHASATRSRKAEDRNLPARQQCQACHDGANLRSVETEFLAHLETTERSYRFDHEFHLKIGNTAPLLATAIDGGAYLGKGEEVRRHLDTADACQACHRGMAEVELASTANLPVMSDCLVCHSEIDNPFSCQKCHLQGVNLRPADHTRGFVDLHSTGKIKLDKRSCLPCHGTNFACMGCH